MATLETTSSLEKRWRPKGTGPVCGYRFRKKICQKKGPHYCEPRADRAVAFFEEHLVHTKGPRVRTAFALADWQEMEIVRPLFGEVVWSKDWSAYRRRYEIFYEIVARKNGKSELDAGLILKLLVADDEEAAEVYCAAQDTKQAGKVFEPANRMRELSPAIADRLRFNKNSRRLYDERTASFYEVLTSDALGELGAGPHGFVLDEVLSQPDGSMWYAMISSRGSRLQPIYIATTTETDRATSFGADLIDEAEAIMFDPKRSPHSLAFVRKMPATDEQLVALRKRFRGHPDLPVSLDVYDERNWKWPNPGLDDFKSREALRTMATEAKQSPLAENAFIQFQMNRRVKQATRWMPMHLYQSRANTEPLWLNWKDPDRYRATLKGAIAYCGLDLAARFDLAAWCLVIPDEYEAADVIWRFWLPEGALPVLDKENGDRFTQWAEDGWLEIHDGEVLDYERIYDAIGQDADFFNIAGGGADKWCLLPVIQAVAARTALEVDKTLLVVNQDFRGMTPGMTHLMELVKTGKFRHHGNPVADFCFDCVQARKAPYDPALVRPDKPDRQKTGKRIDAVPAAAMAVDAWRSRSKVETERSAYEDHDLMVI